MQRKEMTENQQLSTHLVRPVVKPTVPQRSVTLELTQPIDRLPGTNDWIDRLKSNKETLRNFD